MSTTPPTSPPASTSTQPRKYSDTSSLGKKRPHEEISKVEVTSRTSKDGNVQSAGANTGGSALASDVPPKKPLLSKQDPMALAETAAQSTDVVHPDSQSKNVAEEKSSGIAADETFDPRLDVPGFDWSDFEARFTKAMAEQDELQAAIHEEFKRKMNFFGVWAQSAVQHENERANKRLHTRMHYVRRAEGGLVEKREHYVKVVQAFENALALLSGV